MSARTRWIGVILGLLIGNAIAVAVLIGVSSGGTRQRVLPDYYERAAAWDQTMREAEASVALGWQATVAVRGAEVVVTVVDAAGAPVEGAAVELTAVPRGRVDETFTATAAATTDAPGVYRVTLTGHGLHDVALRIVRGEERFVADRLVELGGAS